jgi:hypothetical protein
MTQANPPPESVRNTATQTHAAGDERQDAPVMRALVYKAMSSSTPEGLQSVLSAVFHAVAALAGARQQLPTMLDELGPVRAKAIVNTPQGAKRHTLLHALAALRSPDADGMQKMLAVGGDVHARAKDSSQPLHLALGFDDKVLRTLVVPMVLQSVESEAVRRLLRPTRGRRTLPCG